MSPETRTTSAPLGDQGFVGKNIRAVVELERASHARSSRSERLGTVISRFAGSMRFIVLHVLLFSSWILINQGVGGLEPFDPYPFTFLTFCVSLEAIFLTSFVLISQNRLGRVADERAHLDLQINLLAEQENTQTLLLLQALCRHLNLPPNAHDALVTELAQETKPSQVAQALERERNEEG